MKREFMAEEPWDEWIEAGLAEISPNHLSLMVNVVVLLEDDPSSELRHQEGLLKDETLLGLYQGIPLTERGAEYGVGETLPDTITLYKNPIRAEANETDRDIARVVRETLWHEIGHYFGLDEDAVLTREGERFGKK